MTEKESVCECGPLARPDPMSGLCSLCAKSPLATVDLDCGECGWKGRGEEGQNCDVCGGGPLWVCI